VMITVCKMFCTTRQYEGEITLCHLGHTVSRDLKFRIDGNSEAILGILRFMRRWISNKKRINLDYGRSVCFVTILNPTSQFQQCSSLEIEFRNLHMAVLQSNNICKTSILFDSLNCDVEQLYSQLQVELEYYHRDSSFKSLYHLWPHGSAVDSRMVNESVLWRRGSPIDTKISLISTIISINCPEYIQGGTMEITADDSPVSLLVSKLWKALLSQNRVLLFFRLFQTLSTNEHCSEVAALRTSQAPSVFFFFLFNRWMLKLVVLW
jgi:hypothetical protein